MRASQAPPPAHAHRHPTAAQDGYSANAPPSLTPCPTADNMLPCSFCDCVVYESGLVVTRHGESAP
eukprot:1277650-Rhodomonas_salina.1